MKEKITRRDFIKNSALLSGVIAVQPVFSQQKSKQEKTKQEKPEPDITVAKGENPAKNVRAAINELGGIKKFVSKNDRVVLLPNPQGRQTGTSTNAEVVGETVKMCLEAGAKEVAVCSIHSSGRWSHTGVIEAVKKSGGIMVYPESEKDWVEVEIPNGKKLKKVTIIKRAVENDVLIDMPIAKHHNGARFTCNLKNLMGFNDNNSGFHKGEAHLQQCIADLASVIKPDLCIVDANIILTENGPFGPGDTASPQKVFAGTDLVAIDTLCCSLIKIDPKEVGHIVNAHKLEIGEMDLSKLVIKELKV